MDMNALLAQAQQMQDDMLKAQEAQAAETYQGTAGGEMVAVTMTGLGEVTDIKIASEVCDPEDTETLSALLIAAFRSAKQQADAAAQAAMPQMPQMPEGLGF